MKPFADVALPVSIHRTFTYTIPPDLQESAAIGVRVVVPFGRKLAIGLIVALPPSTDVTGLKPVADVLDVESILTDELLRLCHWIAEYYMAPIGEVIKSALPHAFSPTSKRLAHFRRDLRGAPDSQQMRHTASRAKVIEYLKQHEKAFASDLKKKLHIKNINALLNDLERLGIITTEEIVHKPGIKPKTIEVVDIPRLDKRAINATLDALPPRKKKARQLLQYISSTSPPKAREIPTRELLRLAGVSSTVLKEFRDSGLIPVFLKEVSRREEFGTEAETLSITLNTAQESLVKTICERIQSREHKTLLLHGITGSGKTQTYIEAIRFCLNEGMSAIVLVPEIGLTSQMVRRFTSHFGEAVAVVHSRMSPGERSDVWRGARRGDYRIVIGPRSAVFAPLTNLGLIVVDEEHESSYKQFDAVPRYHARDVAVIRGSMNNATVVLGSATPSAESYWNAGTGKYLLLELPERIDNVPLPSVRIVDMTEERRKEYSKAKEAMPVEARLKLKEFHQPVLSTVLASMVSDRMKRKEGVILLQNRRGYAPFVECLDCGYTEMCTECNVTLTYHLTKKHLRCHYCGTVKKPPLLCPHCGGAQISYKGFGTQRIEEELVAQFPAARILRMDLDTTSRRGAHDRMLRSFGNRQADILLGTQMVAKGLDFSHVTLVGVISADTQMLLPDFRSSERTFQLLTQVAGRAGRKSLEGEVIIQTHQPDHHTLQHVVRHDFKSFYDEELSLRRELGYPPFTRLVLIEVRGLMESNVQREADSLTQKLSSVGGPFTILGPAPAVISRINRQFRWHVILKNRKEEDPAGAYLRHALDRAFSPTEGIRKSGLKVIIDVDPVGLL